MRTIAVYLDEEEESRKRKRRIVAGAVVLIALLAVAKREPPPPPPKPSIVKVVQRVPVPMPVFGPPAPPTVVIRVEVPVPAPRQAVVAEKPQPKVAPPEPPPAKVEPSIATVAPPPPPERHLLIDPMSIHFGAPGWQTVTLTNPNDAAVHIDEIETVPGRGAANAYRVNDRNCRRVLQPRERCTISILAGEIAVRTRAAIRIEIYHDGRSQPTSVSATTGGG